MAIPASANKCHLGARPCRPSTCPALSPTDSRLCRHGSGLMVVTLLPSGPVAWLSWGGHHQHPASSLPGHVPHTTRGRTNSKALCRERVPGTVVTALLSFSCVPSLGPYPSVHRPWSHPPCLCPHLLLQSFSATLVRPLPPSAWLPS